MYFCLVDSYLLFCAFVATAGVYCCSENRCKDIKEMQIFQKLHLFSNSYLSIFQKKRALLPPCFHALYGLERKKVGGDFHRPPPGILTSSFNYKTTFCTFTPFSVVTFTT